jgi:hypothetical protein
MFFGVLLASLGRLPDLLPNHLPLVVLVLLDCVQQRLTLVLCKFCIMHVLVPMLFDGSFRAGGESFGDFCPAVASISHLLQAKLFLRCPGGVGPALLCRWRCNYLRIRIICRGLRRRLGDHCLRCRRSCHRWLDLGGSDRCRSGNCGRRRSSGRCWPFPLPTCRSRRRRRRLLGRRRTIRGLLRNIHGRLNRRWVMLLLLGGLLLLRCHIRLSVLLELMLVITTGHVRLVLMRVAIEACWLAVLPHYGTLLAI